MCDIININNNNDHNMPIHESEEVEYNNYEKYDDFVKDINQHIKSYSQFVTSKYFKIVYSTFKTEEELTLLQNFSETIFEITNEYDLKNFMKYAEQAEKIMDNTEDMEGFCKNFAECFVWHIKEIIMKIKNNNL